MVKKAKFYATGRRKRSIAKVCLQKGTGKITINTKDVYDFFPYKTLVQDLTQPLTITETTEKLDVNVKVIGGGFNGQAGACRLGIARALLEISKDYRAILKKNGMLTRDARVKERKKYGLHKARKAPQYSKR